MSPICQRTCVNERVFLSTFIYNKYVRNLNTKIQKYLFEAHAGLEPAPADYETAILPLN